MKRCRRVKLSDLLLLSRTQGYFVPPVTANYSFWVRGDGEAVAAKRMDGDRQSGAVAGNTPVQHLVSPPLLGADMSYVWLSASADPAGARLIASSPTPTESFTINPPQQGSTPLLLAAGLPYFFRARHVQLGGWTDFFVALRIHTTGNAAATAAFSSENQRIYDSVPDIQTLAVSSARVRAKLTFYVVGVTAESTFQLQWGGFVICPNCGLRSFFTADASAAWVQSVLASSAFSSALGCSSIGVTRSPYSNDVNATGYRWTVTIYCPLSQTPEPLFPGAVFFEPLDDSVEPDNGGDLVVAPSVPLGGYAAFWYDSSNASLPVVVDLSYPWGAASAISSQLLQQPGVSNVAVTNVWWNCNGGRGDAFACESLAWCVPIGLVHDNVMVHNLSSVCRNVTFRRPYGDVPLPMGDASAMSGDNVTAAAWTWVEGSTDTFLFPVPMDYFQVWSGPGL